MTGRTQEEMASVRNLWRSSGILGLTVVAFAAVGPPPAQAGTVGPKQFFTGVINGKDGNTTTPIIIEMACNGHLRPGQTGHPLAGQTLAVHQLFPPTRTSGSLGRTGNDSKIGVFFNAPPPDADRSRSAAGTPVFMRYDKSKPLPTSLILPCAGTGTVWFTPIPVVPPSQSATVPVRYVGQP
jgi:hypothetical protein